MLNETHDSSDREREREREGEREREMCMQLVGEHDIHVCIYMPGVSQVCFDE